MAADDVEKTFPGLRVVRYRITSPDDPAYNCVAWAAGDTQHWWDPSGESGYHWPAAIPRTLSLPSVIAVFSALGFEASRGGRHGPGVERIAIYANAQGLPTHVARELSSGAWTSKLGAAEDIEHETLEGLEGELYGKVALVLRRRRAVSS